MQHLQATMMRIKIAILFYCCPWLKICVTAQQHFQHLMQTAEKTTIQYLQTAAEANEYLIQISSLNKLVIGLDFERIKYGHEDGQITLAQIFLRTKKQGNLVVIIDLLKFGSDISNAMKKFASSSCIKVMQDCRKDVYHMYNMYNVVLQNVYDIQVAHKQLNGSRNVGIAELIPWYLGIEHKTKSLFESMQDSNKSLWKKRPLTPEMKQYAAEDVTHLRAIYEELCKEPNMPPTEYIMQLSIMRCTLACPECDLQFEEEVDLNAHRNLAKHVVLACPTCSEYTCLTMHSMKKHKAKCNTTF